MLSFERTVKFVAGRTAAGPFSCYRHLGAASKAIGAIYFWSRIAYSTTVKLLTYRIRGNRTPAFYSFLRPLWWRTIRNLSNFTVKKGHFEQKSGILIKMTF